MDRMTRTFSGRWIAGVAVLVSLTSCDSGFDDLNTDKTRQTSLEAPLLLNRAIVNSAMNFNNLLCESTVIRQGIAPFTGVLTCANINQDNKQTGSTNWDRFFGSNGIRELTAAISDSDPGANVHHMARIWRAYGFMVVTDTYGDVPYSEAALGYLDGIAFPKYDAQEQIYTGENGILQELAEASVAIDVSQAADSRIILYGGDPVQWKRIGYSLLLRAAMRLSKVQPGVAQQFVGTAVSGGLMESNADNAIIRHTSDYRNPVGTTLNGGEAANYYLDEFFVEYLQANNDPRLAAIAVRYPQATSGSQQTEADADRTPGNQLGMPQGYDNNTIVPIVEAAGLPSLYAYSQIDRTRVAGTEAPTFIVTYAQTQLLLAEAAARGWTAGDAAALYASGVEAHMQQMAEYGPAAAIDQGAIDTYLAANPYDPARALEQINTQYWVASFMNGPEAWANFRRTGFPNLEPNPLSGDLETEPFIRRFTYPDAEYSVNSDNLTEATSRQGADRLDVRVWWDTE